MSSIYTNSLFVNGNEAEVTRLSPAIIVNVNLKEVLSVRAAQKNLEAPFITPATDPVAVNIASLNPNSNP